VDLPQNTRRPRLSRLRQRYPDVFEAVAPLNWVEPLAWLTDVLERMISA
jgi:hypothetical protein